MKGILCASLLILLMPSVACAAALPGDSADGKRLHDANCMGCHDTGIYTREDRCPPTMASWDDRKLSQSCLVALAMDWAALTSQSSFLLLKSCNTLNL